MVIGILALNVTSTYAKKKPTIPKIEWANANASVIKFRNGDTILYANSTASWQQACANKQAAYCKYENNDSLGNTIGFLYNWYAISDPRILAPKGWRIPNELDWKTYETQINKTSDSMNQTDSNQWHQANIFDKKDLNFQYGGDRSHKGEFNNLGQHMAWWSIDAPTGNSWSAHGFGWYSGVDTDESNGKCVGLYVRFIRE